jgi:hypothetical protein
METLVIVLVLSGLVAIGNLAGWLACRIDDDRYEWSLWIFAGPWIYYDKVVRNDSN